MRIGKTQLFFALVAVLGVIVALLSQYQFQIWRQLNKKQREGTTVYYNWGYKWAPIPNSDRILLGITGGSFTVREAEDDETGRPPHTWFLLVEGASASYWAWDLDTFLASDWFFGATPEEQNELREQWIAQFNSANGEYTGVVHGREDGQEWNLDASRKNGILLWHRGVETVSGEPLIDVLTAPADQKPRNYIDDLLILSEDN